MPKDKSLGIQTISSNISEILAAYCGLKELFLLRRVWGVGCGVWCLMPRLKTFVKRNNNFKLELHSTIKNLLFFPHPTPHTPHPNYCNRSKRSKR